MISAAAALGGVGALMSSLPAAAREKGGPLLGFQGIPVSTADTVVVPDGYTARVLIAWGDPVSDGPGFRPDAGNTAADQAQQWGINGVPTFIFDRRYAISGAQEPQMFLQVFDRLRAAA